MRFNVFTWEHVDHPAVTKMARAHPPTSTARDAAERTAEELSALPAGRRAILSLNEVPQMGWDGRDDWDRDDPAHFVVQGPRWGARRDWYAEYFWRIRKVPRVDHLVVDCETGFSNWHFPSPEHMARIWADPAAKSKLPLAFQPLDPLADFTMDKRQNIIEWNRWANTQYSTHLKQLLADTFFAATGYRPRYVTNYANVRAEPGATINDPNGWPLYAGALVNASAPVLYWERWATRSAAARSGAWSPGPCRQTTHVGEPRRGEDRTRALARESVLERYPQDTAGIDKLLADVIACSGTVCPWIAFLEWYGEPLAVELLGRLAQTTVKDVLAWWPVWDGLGSHAGNVRFAELLAQLPE